MRSLFDEDFFQIRIPIGPYELESLNDDIKRNIIAEEHFTESDSPFHIKPIFSTLGSIIEKKPQVRLNGSVFNGSIGNLLGFEEIILYKGKNVSPNPVDI